MRVIPFRAGPGCQPCGAPRRGAYLLFEAGAASIAIRATDPPLGYCVSAKAKYRDGLTAV